MPNTKQNQPNKNTLRHNIYSNYRKSKEKNLERSQKERKHLMKRGAKGKNYISFPQKLSKQKCSGMKRKC